MKRTLLAALLAAPCTVMAQAEVFYERLLQIPDQLAPARPDLVHAPDAPPDPATLLRGEPALISVEDSGVKLPDQQFTLPAEPVALTPPHQAPRRKHAR